jgi:hypothetical protein
MQASIRASRSRQREQEAARRQGGGAGLLPSSLSCLFALGKRGRGHCGDPACSGGSP